MMMENLKVDPSSELVDSNLVASKDGTPSDAISCISSSGDATSNAKGSDVDQESLVRLSKAYIILQAITMDTTTKVMTVQAGDGRTNLTTMDGMDWIFSTLPKCLEKNVEENPKSTSSISTADSSTIEFLAESECYDFGIDLFSEVVPFQSGNPVRGALSNRANEDRKIKDLVDTPALGCQRQAQEASVYGRGLKSGIDSRNARIGGFVSKIPPQGYICRRCKIAGHFIQHCPTNGDPDFDIKKLKPPKVIPKSMFMETPDGSCAFPSGAVAVLKPNEAAFEKEIEGILSVHPVINVPPELHCPLCKEVMKDAVLSSKCCFNSFCDKCIRDHINSKSMCVCGSMKMLVDDLLPNKTIRETIKRILGSTTRSAFSGSSVHVQDMKSACNPQPKVLLPTVSAATKEECATPLCENDTSIMQETRKEGKADLNMLELSSKKSWATKNISRSEVIIESVSVREATSQSTALQAKEGVQQKLPVGKKGDLQWKTSEAFVAENYVMPSGPPACNQFLGGMQLGVYGDIMHYSIPMPPYMGYTSGVFCHQDPYGVGGYGYMISDVPQSQREFSKHREFDMEVSNCADTTSIKLKPVCFFVPSFPSKPCPTPILLYLAIYFCIMSVLGRLYVEKCVLLL